MARDPKLWAFVMLQTGLATLSINIKMLFGSAVFAVLWLCRWSGTSKSSEQSSLPEDSQDCFRTHRSSSLKLLPTRR